ncbi:unnamed protein product [Phaedon cochleariae]|uniref:PDZ domain-containing protein n=1 Tax=Phaedon cochleariae TaxID=80249 RepID=A0A9N9SGW3_PHACE|nr:unnamed protein product [Phaedon cochleariae]
MARPRLFDATPIILLLCSVDWTRAQADAATTSDGCYGGGSVAAAVVVTCLLTALVLGVCAVWWRRYRAKQVPDHLILETDPEKGKGVYAFDNPGFKDASYLAAAKQHLDADKSDLTKSKWQWTPLSAFAVKSERRRALDDSAIEGNAVKVISLKSHDFTGLGFNICGNMKEGIFVKDVLQRGPASESGKLNSGDRIHSVTINFEHIVYEDALTILGYASPYEVTIEATSGKSALNSPDQGGQPSHPVYRSSSWSDLYRVGKSSKRKLFGDDVNEPNSTHSSMQKSRSNMTTLERKESKSPKPKQPRTKKPSALNFSPDKIQTQLEQKIVSDSQSDPELIHKIENKHQKFGVRVLPMEIQQKSPKILEQNENNINIEKNQLNAPILSIDEVDDPKKPPPVRRREKKQSGETPEKADNFDRNSLNGSGIKRTKEGIPLELPAHMLNAASAALRNREDDSKNKRKGRAPAVPEETRNTPTPSKEYNSDSDAEENHSSVNTIELNATEITIHQIEDEQLQNRKTLSAGDLSQIRRQNSPIGTLERAQSLDIPDSEEVLHKEPRLSLILDGLSTFERNRLKKSSEWGQLEDAILKSKEEDPDEEFDAVINKVNELRRESRMEEPKIKNQIWPSFDGHLNGSMAQRAEKPVSDDGFVRRERAVAEKTVTKPLPPPVRKTVNNRIDEPFEAARSNTKAVASLEAVNTDQVKLPRTGYSGQLPEFSRVEDETAPNNLDTVDFGPHRSVQDNAAGGDNYFAENAPTDKETDNIVPNKSSLEQTVAELETASKVPETINLVPHRNEQTNPIESHDFIKSNIPESQAVGILTASKDPDTIDAVPYKNYQEMTIKNNDFVRSYTSIEFPAAKSRTALNETETVNIVPHSFQVKKSAEHKTAAKDSESVDVLPNSIENYFTSESQVVGNETALNNSGTVNLVPHLTPLEFPANENKIASKETETVKIVPHGSSYGNTIAGYETASKDSETINVVSHRNNQETAMKYNDSITAPESQVVGISTVSEVFEPINEVQYRNGREESKEFSTAENNTSNETKIVNIVPHRINQERTAVTNDVAKFSTSLEVSLDDDESASNGLDSVHVVPQESRQMKPFAMSNTPDSPSVEVEKTPSDVENWNAKSYTSIEFPLSEDTKASNNTAGFGIHRENSPVKDKTASNDHEASYGSTPIESVRTKSYTSFEIPMNEDRKPSNRLETVAVIPDRTNRRQRQPEDVEPNQREPAKPGEVLSKIPLLNSMVANQKRESRAGNVSDETKTAATLNTAGLTHNFLYTEQLNSYSYGITNVPDDVKVSYLVPDDVKSLTNVNVTKISNGDNELHSLELSVNENSDLYSTAVESTLRLGSADAERSYVTEIRVTPNGSGESGAVPTGRGFAVADGKVEGEKEEKSGEAAEENELEKIKEIAERQLKKLPEMRFTTSSYEPSRIPEKRHSNIEHLRSNFEKPKLQRQESKSRIPIATTHKTPPTSPERRDSRHLDAEQDEAILELMAASVSSTPAKYQFQPRQPPAKNVTVTSIRSPAPSKLPSGLPTLGGGRSPPRKTEGSSGGSRGPSDGPESPFKRWVFDASNVTNVTVTDDRRE